MGISEARVIELSSGKDAAYENFPVGSWILPRESRPHIACFYKFARVADDIADNPTISADEKIALLDKFRAVLTGELLDDPACKVAHQMRESLVRTGITARHCMELLAAFKLDATKLRYRCWDDLMDYCILSAAPGGRYLLDLLGGARDGYETADALCIALQVINHLQDCRNDYLTLNRVYIPTDWMEAAGAPIESLSATATSASLRTVFERTICATDRLLTRANSLPGHLVSRRLAMESGAIIFIARQLIQFLKQQDPLENRIELTKPRFLACCLTGSVWGYFQ